MAMSTIEACTTIISHKDDLGDVDEDMMDPIIYAVDFLDGLVEGLEPNFAGLVNGSDDCTCIVNVILFDDGQSGHRGKRLRSAAS